MISDDTEHTVAVLASLMAHPGDVKGFQRELTRRLRWWFLALPAGIGLATARSLIKSCLGWPVGTTGVWSAGNGPAMRAAIIGVVYANDPVMRREVCDASSSITHRDPRALEAARMVAAASAMASQGTHGDAEILLAMAEEAKEPIWQEFWPSLCAALGRRDPVVDFARSVGFGEKVSGYAPHTVIMAIYIWLRHRGDFSRSITEAVACGGDTDTLAAIVGGIAGAETLPEAFPTEWLQHLKDRPINPAYLRQLAEHFQAQDAGAPGVLVSPFRNLMFLIIVLAHGFRRLLPPY